MKALLRKTSLVLAAMMMALVIASLPAQAATTAKSASTSVSVSIPETEIETVLTLVNSQRAAAGLAPLRWSDQLASDATVRATECATSYSHTRPGGSDWWTVDSDLMYGENLAANYTTAQTVVSTWMASPAHKANIMNSGYVTIGIATYTTESGDVYWAEEFSY